MERRSLVYQRTMGCYGWLHEDEDVFYPYPPKTTLSTLLYGMEKGACSVDYTAILIPKEFL